MKDSQELPKAYTPADVESQIFAAWEASGAFDPDQLPERNQKGEPYCIVLPPPNRTGTLHMGHAKMLAIQDALMRFYRMDGRKTYWVPGTDHAAIATQTKVEQLLQKEGIKDPRKELGREKFLERVRAFAEQSRVTIIEQCKRMGSSMDWKREKYTLDEERNHAVNVMFKMMYEDGLIERGERIVNWDPTMQSNVSDDEIEWKQERVPFYTFKYGPFEISTARPETKFGDKYVVMHPDDQRYAQYKHGDTFTCEWINGPVTATVIKDAVIDMEFGTGVMTITPWHDATDFEIAERHKLEAQQIIGFDGRLLAVADEFAGMSIEEARPKIVEKLREKGLLVKTEEGYEHNVAVNYRGGAKIEPQIRRQWFVRVNKPFALRQDTLGKWKKGDKATLKELMLEAVTSKQTTIIPDNFEKIYFHWVNNLRDWCISRQIWFGHQIPVWYRGEETVVSDISPGADWTRDPDTLDTWFSSGMWTFSTLGWPEKTKELETFHPTAVLETGYDILFFWVARMVLMSAYALGEVPFKDVYLHGLVRDEQGRKMSKSLGNVIDPLDVIPTYGTDAVRLSLVMGTTPGMDQKLSEEKIKDFRNFTNKLWNIGRFIISNLTPSPYEGEGRGEVVGTSLADRWILSRLDEVTASVTQKIKDYQLAQAGEELRDFTWGDLADWYLEIAKVEGNKSAILTKILQTILKLWHPFMPYVTEHLWKTAGFDGLLILAEWPTQITHHVTRNTADDFEHIRTLVTDMRRLRAEQKVEPAKKVTFAMAVDATVTKLVEGNRAWILRMTNAEELSLVAEVDKSWPAVSSGNATIALNLAGTVDLAQERAKMEKELAETEAYIASLDEKLANQEFIGKAPAKVIDGMKLKREDAIKKQETLKGRLST
ncbi:MAG: valine--tRNA ligase [Patescibacteria group bacterium]